MGILIMGKNKNTRKLKKNNTSKRKKQKRNYTRKQKGGACSGICWKTLDSWTGSSENSPMFELTITTNKNIKEKDRDSPAFKVEQIAGNIRGEKLQHWLTLHVEGEKDSEKIQKWAIKYNKFDIKKTLKEIDAEKTKKINEDMQIKNTENQKRNVNNEIKKVGSYKCYKKRVEAF